MLLFSKTVNSIELLIIFLNRTHQGASFDTIKSLVATLLHRKINGNSTSKKSKTLAKIDIFSDLKFGSRFEAGKAQGSSWQLTGRFGA